MVTTNNTCGNIKTYASTKCEGFNYINRIQEELVLKINKEIEEKIKSELCVRGFVFEDNSSFHSFVVKRVSFESENHTSKRSFFLDKTELLFTMTGEVKQDFENGNIKVVFEGTIN